jgi:hypothetical protein
LSLLYRFATGLPARLDDALRPRRADPALAALLPAVLLLAALQLPEGPLRTAAAIACGLGLLVVLLRR